MVYRFCIIKTGKVFETLLNLGFSEYSQKKTFLSICQNLFKLKTSKSSYKRFLYNFLFKKLMFFLYYIGLDIHPLCNFIEMKYHIGQ